MRDAGGVLLAFLGVVVLIGAVRGTWRDAWDVLTGSAEVRRGEARAGAGLEPTPDRTDLPPSHRHEDGGVAA